MLHHATWVRGARGPMQCDEREQNSAPFAAVARATRKIAEYDAGEREEQLQ